MATESGANPSGTYKTSAQSNLSHALVAALADQLVTMVPFCSMSRSHVELFASQCHEQYYEPGETILNPAAGVPDGLFLIRQGEVSGERVAADGHSVYFELEAGDMFSIGAVLTRRPVTTSYKAIGDCFCLQFPASSVVTLGIESPPFIEFLTHQFRTILEQSQLSLRQHFAALAAQAQLHQNTLGSLLTREPVFVEPSTPLIDALTVMDDKRIGSILVVDADAVLQGILTRYDLLKRVVLARVDLTSPIQNVMTPNPKTLEVTDTIEAATELMTRANIRHVPLTQDKRVVGLISERDLFSFQRFSVGNISAAIAAAKEVAHLKRAGEHIAQYARNLLSQGVTGHRLTSLVSHLNDLLTVQMISLLAQKHGLDQRQFCWIALGSEGRQEQTIATDQDNALILDDALTDEQQAQMLKFAREVNEGLDACGFPLCKGNVMASNPDYCLSQRQWLARCANWIDRGTPQDLLDASIFFDFRALAGNLSLADPIQDQVARAAANAPRFIALLAANACKWKVPLTIFGGIDTTRVDGYDTIDLKLNGTALMVDFARIYALANGITERGTKPRLEAVARALDYDEKRTADWISAFEYLQTLRLKAQMSEPVVAGNANALDVGSLSKVDKVILKAALNVTKTMQQQLRLDYVR
jgi:CBS domain-containing protein